MSPFARLVAWLSPTARADRRNVAALAARIGTTEAEAAVIYRRSREVGFGAAMTEHRQRCADATHRHDLERLAG